MTLTEIARIGALVTGLVLHGFMARASAEKVDSQPEQLRACATHVFTGKVESVTASRELEGSWEVLRCNALVLIQTVEKGEGFAAGDRVGCRYWTRRWIALGKPPASTNGHSPLPRSGETVRVHVVDKGYNGFGETRDGGFDVVGRNGWQVLSPLGVDETAGPLYDALSADWRKRAFGILVAAFVTVGLVVWFIRKRKLKHA